MRQIVAITLVSLMLPLCQGSIMQHFNRLTSIVTRMNEAGNSVITATDVELKSPGQTPTVLPTAASADGYPTTTAPTITAPATAAPASAALNNAVSTTAASTTAGSTTAPSTTVTSTTAASTTAGPTTTALTIATSTNATPTTAAPTSSATTTAAPATVGSTSAVPTTDAQTTNAQSLESKNISIIEEAETAHQYHSNLSHSHHHVHDHHHVISFAEDTNPNANEHLVFIPPFKRESESHSLVSNFLISLAAQDNHQSEDDQDQDTPTKSKPGKISPYADKQVVVPVNALAGLLRLILNLNPR